MSSTPQRPQVPTDMRAFNRQLIEEFRAHGGKLSGRMAASHLVLLTTTGRKTAQPRTVVLGYVMEAERFLVIASDNGSDTAPSWYRNLLADPNATVEVGAEKFQVRARDADADERPGFGERIPYFAGQQALTSREIPIVVLERA